MDPTKLNTLIGIVGSIVGIIGIIVGIIGGKSLRYATNIKSKIKAGENARIQNAQIINNGLDSYAVIKLSRDTTQKELGAIINRIRSVETTVEELPRFYCGSEEPENPKDGDIWFKP